MNNHTNRLHNYQTASGKCHLLAHRPKEIGAKIERINGKTYKVRIFEGRPAYNLGLSQAVIYGNPFFRHSKF